MPVAIIHLGTDEDSEIVFQVAKEQIQELMEHLSRLLKRFEAAERWAGARSARESAENV